MKRSPLERQAIRWLVKIKTAESVDEDLWSEFEDWLENPEHHAMYVRMERVWHLMEEALRGGLGRPRPAGRKGRRKKRD